MAGPHASAGVRTRAGRTMGSFVDECVGAVPKEVRGRYQLWQRVGSVGYAAEVLEAAERHNMVLTITAKKTTRAQAAICALARDPATMWMPPPAHQGRCRLSLDDLEG